MRLPTITLKDKNTNEVMVKIVFEIIQKLLSGKIRTIYNLVWQYIKLKCYDQAVRTEQYRIAWVLIWFNPKNSPVKIWNDLPQIAKENSYTPQHGYSVT